MLVQRKFSKKVQSVKYNCRLWKNKLHTALTPWSVLKPSFPSSGGSADFQYTEMQYCVFPGSSCGTIPWCSRSTGALLCAWSTYWRCYRMWLIAMWGMDWTHRTPDTLMVCETPHYLEFCSSKPEILQTLIICRWCLTLLASVSAHSHL